MESSDWGECPHCCEPLMTWDTIFELGEEHPVSVLVKCPACYYSEVRSTPAGAEADLKGLLEELS